jgi:hypothetical protein
MDRWDWEIRKVLLHKPHSFLFRWPNLGAFLHNTAWLDLSDSASELPCKLPMLEGGFI